MPVEHAKEAALRPVLDVLFRWWLHDVEHDGHSVLIVVPDDALIGIRCVAHDDTIFADTALGGLPAREIQSDWVRWRTVAQQEFLYVQWLHLCARRLAIISMILHDARCSIAPSLVAKVSVGPIRMVALALIECGAELVV